MSAPMREPLLALIASAQEAAKTGGLRTHIEVSAGGANDVRLWFGYGYFRPDKVLVWSTTADGQTPAEMEPGPAVDKFLGQFAP